MPDLLFCSRVHDDGRCDHPVTGERYGDVVPDHLRVACTVCGHLIRRDPADHPELEAACVDHIDDDEWVKARIDQQDTPTPIPPPR